MHFSFEHTVPLGRERVFGFFENPERLKLLHAGWSKIRVLRHESQVRTGAETWVEIMVAGLVPVVLGFRHTIFEPPARFSEVAIHGPFSRFIHIHEFSLQEGKTIVRDLLEVCLPWYYGGETIMKRVVAPVIKRIFHHRAEALTRLAYEGTLARCAASAAKER